MYMICIQLIPSMVLCTAELVYSSRIEEHFSIRLARRNKISCSKALVVKIIVDATIIIIRIIDTTTFLTNFKGKSGFLSEIV